MSGLYIGHVRELVIMPSLRVFPLEMQTAAAVELLVGTALVESGCEYLKQGLHTVTDGQGVALGLWQCEPATFEDIWINYLAYHPELGEAIGGEQATAVLMTNLAYAAQIARLHYWRYGEPAAGLAADDVW